MNVAIHDLDRVHVLLWSMSQQCFHVETIKDTIESGLRAFVEKNYNMDYIVLAVSADRAELDKFADDLERKHGRP